MKNLLYNNDGTLSTEVQFLLSTKPDEMSLAEWRKKLKEFKVQLSVKDLEKFNRLRNNAKTKRRYTKNPEKAKQLAKAIYAKNPEKIKQNAKARYAKNPEKSKQAVKTWRTKNPEKVKQLYKSNYAKNPEKVKQIVKTWRAKNPEKTKQYIKDYHKQRRVKDPLYQLQCNMRSMGNRVVKQLSLGKKPACTEKWQGCSAEELKAHLESLFTEGMSWDNYGEWHVDHIRPVSSFTAEEAMQINHYTNLQPLWAEDNLSKSDDYN
jgi:hypothetical protein